MELYFENSKGEMRCIAHVANMKETSKEIKKFLDEHNYKSHYTRMWGTERDGYGPCLCFDVGSHSEFFYVAFHSKEERDNFIQGLRQ